MSDCSAVHQSDHAEGGLKHEKCISDRARRKKMARQQEGIARDKQTYKESERERGKQKHRREREIERYFEREIVRANEKVQKREDRTWSERDQNGAQPRDCWGGNTRSRLQH